MIGNSLVVPVLKDWDAPYWWVLLLSGTALMILVNMNFERNES